MKNFKIFERILQHFEINIMNKWQSESTAITCKWLIQLSKIIPDNLILNNSISITCLCGGYILWQGSGSLVHSFLSVQIIVSSVLPEGYV